MSVTLTYKPSNTSVLFKALSTARHFGVLMLLGALLMPISAQADESFFDLKKLLPSASKFKFPDLNLGNISIWKNDMQKAKKAYRKGKYRKARKYLHKALKNGNFLAAWYLGHIHRQGLGVPVDHGKAFHFYRTVALEYDDDGLPPRMFLIVLDSLVRVADGYRTGVKSGGVSRDFRRAMRLYNKAANRGHPAAQYGLASMFLKGQGVKKNGTKAVRWYQLSARKRFPPALAQLGEFSLQGRYFRKSKIRATAMYMVATRDADEGIYADLHNRLDQLSRKLDDEEYQQAQEVAEGWIQRNQRQYVARKRPRREPRLAQPPIRPAFRPIGPPRNLGPIGPRSRRLGQ